MRHAPRAKAGNLTLSWTDRQKDGTPALYVFNRGINNGFVIISADDNAREVLGYSNQGRFDAADIPVNMRKWLDLYKDEIRHAATLSPARLAARPKKQAQQTYYNPVAPICSTLWGQGDPYNILCPTDAGGQCVTGCVATAAAQVMKAHNYPATGTGSHSYTWTDKDGNETELSANFGNTTYRWDLMLDTYGTSATTAQKNAVATLMSHCGIACEMGYTSDESGANTMQMLKAMIEYFGYDAAIKSFSKDCMTEEAFVDSINVDLQAGRPVYFSGRTVNNEGHAFVCDGIDADGMVHINWGWYGSCDGYFRVSALDPEDQGIGGSSGNYAFTERVMAYGNIKPDEGGQPCYTIICDSVDLPKDKFNKQSDYIHVRLANLNNINATTWVGHTAFKIYQNGALYDDYIYSSFSSNLPAGYFYYNYNFYGYLSDLPAGEYELVPAITPSTESTYCSPVLLSGVGEIRLPMTVTDDSIFLSNPYAVSDAPTPEVLSQYYDIVNDVVLCTRFMDPPCYDVYFVGTPTGWAASFSGCPKFEPLPGYDGWYAVSVPYASGLAGKPMQVDYDGSFSWENQTGDPGAWVNRGNGDCKEATIQAGFGGEADVYYPSAGCYVYDIKYWKNHNNDPCDHLPKIHYTVYMYAPDACADMKPSIIGTFNDWEAGLPMYEYQEADRTLYYYTIESNARGTIKFREVNDTDWSNQILYFDQNEQVWKGMENIPLPMAESDTAIFFDFSDNAMYRFTECNIRTGKCGDNLTWTLDTESGVLTISGYGDMYDYDYGTSPWYNDAENITSIILPDGLTRIGERAFNSVDNMQTASIPANVISIGDYAFYACISLESITIPASVEEIGSGAFGGCYSLPAINVAAANPNYCAIDGVLFSKDETELLQYPAGKAGNSYAIPEGTNYISNSAFGDCYNLQTITIPEGVTVISHYAFEYAGITSLTIPKSLQQIGAYIAVGCDNLTEVQWNAINCAVYANGSNIYPPFDNSGDITSFTFGEEVEVIPTELCIGMNYLTSLTIPQSVTLIEMGAFAFCEELTEVTCHAAVPPVCEEDVFYGVTVENIPLYVSPNSLALYQEADTWKDFLVQAKSTVSITNTEDGEAQTYKVLRDGQLYIIRNGITCTVNGERIND